MESTLAVECFSLIEKIPPRAQKIIKRAIGVGVAAFLARAVWTSREFQAALEEFSESKNSDMPSIQDQIRAKYPDFTSFSLYDIPGFVRRKIFLYLESNDVENIRLVCRRFQWDIDFVIGVPALSLDSRTERFDFYKRVAIRTCSVVHLNPRNLDFLVKPLVLESLEMNESCAINPKGFIYLLRKCVRIRYMNIHVWEDTSSNGLIFDIIEKYHTRNGSILESIDVTYMPSSETCKWILVFKKLNGEFKVHQDGKDENENNLAENNKGDQVFPAKVKCVRLNFEDFRGVDGHNYAKSRLFWKEFLVSQTSMKILECNFKPGSWDVYSEIILNNSKTLEKFCLTNVGHWDYWDEHEYRECPYKWNFLTKCEKLVYISIAADDRTTVGPRLYVPLNNCQIHLCVLHCDFGLTFWRLYASVLSMNANTLQDVCLRRLMNMDTMSCRESIFDWKTFAKCRALKNLEISGAYRCILETENFNALPTETLSSLKLNFVALSVDDVRKIVKTMPNLTTDFDFLQSCQIKGIQHGESVEDLIKRLNRVPAWHAYYDGFKHILPALPLPEIAATAWIYFSKNDF